MRDGIARLGGNPSRVNPLQPVELVIDHSVQVDYFGQANAFQLNAELEFSRNKERYAFLRWGQNAFENFRVVPPDTGIVHQVNLEYLARVVMSDDTPGGTLAYPDTLVGTDSHTTMINGLGVVGWGVGGIEAEAAMLGQPISMLIPPVLGFRLTGAMLEGATATDLVLTITERLRKHGVVGKFVEFFGPGLEHLTIADRATLGNMCPEYGATIAIFPIDDMTLDYLRLTGRDESRVQLVEAYAKAQGLFRRPGDPDSVYSECIELDLGTIEPSLAGPRRPQDRVSLKQAKSSFQTALGTLQASAKKAASVASGAAPAAAAAGAAVAELPVVGQLDHGSVVIAAITSCTNTSNPSVMIGAGLLAKRAVERGLRSQPWVKTSLAPGSKVVTEYLRQAGLQQYLDQLGFSLVGYGCTTCIGNSGPLPDEVAAEVESRNLVVAAVLSGNRNFEGRIQQQVRANYLASPPLVVAYAIAGKMTMDLTTEPLGTDRAGQPVYLRDIWPTEREIQETMLRAVNARMFREAVRGCVHGRRPLALAQRAPGRSVCLGTGFDLHPQSAVLRWPHAPARASRGYHRRAHAGDARRQHHDRSHLAGRVHQEGQPRREISDGPGRPACRLQLYGARRGNHEVMMRGTFANIRLRNLLAPGTEGGWTTYQPGGDVMPIYDAAMKYKQAGVPLIVLAGKEYGSGSSRDWAAKGTLLLGVRVVIAESFERIHRSNLVNMGVLPLQFQTGQTAASLGLTGREEFDITGIATGLQPGRLVQVRGRGDRLIEFEAVARIDTPEELVAFYHGGILPYVLRELGFETDDDRWLADNAARFGSL